jgi:acetyl esterase/lipase
MKAAGIPVEFHRYKNPGHGFGLGTGTTAEGWMDLAVKF